MLPGQFEAYAHRKPFCEGQVKEGIDEEWFAENLQQAPQIVDCIFLS